MRTIVALGGGQTTDSVRDYQVGVTGKERPKLLYLNTASAHDPRQALRTFQTLSRVAAVELVEFFPWPPDGLRELTLEQDIVFVGGGNTANMLAIWRVHGVDRALRAAYDGGTVLTGWSAGCICWFEGGTTDSFTPELGALRDGLGFLEGSATPHYDSEERRPMVYAREIAAGLPAGIALDDGVAASYADERLAEVVSGRADGRAFRVDRSGEHPLPVRVL